MSRDLCRLHYRPAVGLCSDCRHGVCGECSSPRGLCPQCVERREIDDAMARERRRSRIALRRAGIAMHSERGDPVILREGPLRLVVPLAGAAATVFAAAAACALLERGLGLDPAVSVVLCGAVIGLCIRLLFGGVSRTAGALAAGLCVTAAVAGRWWAGTYIEPAGTSPGLRPVSDWVLAHGAVAPALYLIAAVIAYGAAAGHRAA